MATANPSVAPDNSTAANFRAWGKALSDALTTFGITKTTDTGQIDWTSVAAPTAATTAQGYEIRRFTDSLAATKPVYLKLEYGSGSSAGYPSIWLTIGTGSDGAGNLTGILFARLALVLPSSSTTAQSCYLSGAAGRVSVMMWGLGSSQPMAFAVERTHDASGADTGDGLYVVTLTSAGVSSQYLPFSGLAPARQPQWNCVVPPSGSGALSPNIYTFPVRCWTPGESFPLHSVMAYVSTDFTKGAAIAVTSFDSVSRTYVALGTVAVGYGGTGYSMWRYD